MNSAISIQTSLPIFSELGQRAEPPVISRLMQEALETPGLLSLAAGFTDNIALPDDLVGMALQELRDVEQTRAYLQYGTTVGRPRLREQVLKHVRGGAGEQFALEAEDVLITNGSQQALYLAVQTLCDPGDILLVERPSYFVFLEMLHGLGIRALSIPCDDDGNYDLPALEARLESLHVSGELPKLKGAYLVSYFANPSTRCRTWAEKNGLAEVLQRKVGNLPILEDAAYRDLYFETPCPCPSVLSLDAFSGFPCLYFGTFTKPFATGLKVGYVLGNSRPWVEKMGYIKGHQDFGTANFNQAILETMLKQGYYNRHLNRARKHYHAKSQRMNEVLNDCGLRGRGWHWEEPEGGLLYWLQAPQTIDTRAGGSFYQKCITHKVLYVPGDLCYGDTPATHCVRLAFGSIPEKDLSEAVQRFARSC